MLELLRRLLKSSPKSVDMAPLKAWAVSRGYDFGEVREGDGCLIEPASPHPSWRIEWGVSQRVYMPGRELRIIGEANTPRDLTAMVITRPLMLALEKQVFDQYVEDVQTRMDQDTPPEMRWLVMFPKLPGAVLGRLREHFGAVGSIKGWAQAWMAGSLNDALAATLEVTRPESPMVMSLQRGRLTLRTVMDVADTTAVVMWLSVFEHALREARRLSREWQDSAETSRSTQPAAWPKAMQPGDGTN